MCSATKLLELRNGGMFSQVNEVIENLIKAEQEGYTLAVSWPNSWFESQSRPETNPWEYYFCQPHHKYPRDTKNTVSRIFRTGEEVIAPIVEVDHNGSQDIVMLPPKDRHLVSNIISNYINLKQNIYDEIHE